MKKLFICVSILFASTPFLLGQPTNVALGKFVDDDQNNMSYENPRVTDGSLSTSAYSTSTCPGEGITLIVELGNDYFIQKTEGPDLEITWLATASYSVWTSADGSNYVPAIYSGSSGNTRYFEVNDWAKTIKFRLTPTQGCSTRFYVYEIIAWGSDQPTNIGYFGQVGIGTTNLVENLTVNGNADISGNIDANDLIAPSAHIGTAWINLIHEDIYSLDLNNSSGVSLKAAGSINVGGDITSNGKIECEEIEVKDIACNSLETEKVRTDEIIVKAENVADYVFEDDYTLHSLTDLESFINAYHHLPEIPSAAELEENGMNIAEMNILLLKKIEELTLYIIEQNKRIETLEKVK